MKKTLTILVVVLLGGAVLGVGIWFGLKKIREEGPSSPPANGLPVVPGDVPVPLVSPSGGGGGAVSPNNQTFGVVSQAEAIAYAVDSQNAVFLVSPDGSVVRVKNGNTEVFGKPEEGAGPINSASFSYDGKKALASFENDEGLRWSVFDTSSSTAWESIASGISRAVWAPNDYRIAYFEIQNGYQALMTKDLAKSSSKPQKLISSSAPRLNLFWPSPTYLFFADKPSAFARNSAWRLDLPKNTLSPLALDERAFHFIWSSTANLGLAFRSAINEKGGELFLVTKEGLTQKSFNLLSLPEKCAFYTDAPAYASTTRWLLCGIPRDQQTFASYPLPDAYYKKQIFTSDDIYGINLDDGSLVSLFQDESYAVDANDLKVAGGALFFINRRDNKVYAVSLKPLAPQ